MPNFGGLELLVIVLIVLLLFGAKKLPELARSVGRAQKEFKQGVQEGSSEPSQEPPAPSNQTTTPASGTETAPTDGQGERPSG